MNIEFKQEFLNLLNQLSIINPKIKMEKDEINSVIVRRKSSANNMGYILSASEDCFNFEEDELAFYDYPSFYQLLKVFNEPIIEHNNRNIIIKEGKSKINFVTSDPEVIPDGMKKNCSIPPFDTILKLTVSNLKEIKKLISLLKAENVKYSVSDDNINIKLLNNTHDNSWDNEYKLETKVEKDFELMTQSEIFKVLPEYEYDIHINSDMIKFSLQMDNINLDLYVTSIE